MWGNVSYVINKQRFYRPPEVILGLEYDRMVDLWSTSVTLAELFTGSVLFPGSSNNDILSKFMDALGPFSHKMVRRHAASYAKMGWVKAKWIWFVFGHLA